jgi:hypothetical protein
LLPDKPTQYYVYDYQGKRVRSVVESNNQAQSQRDYLPALDISTNQPSKTTKQNATHWYPHPQRKQQSKVILVVVFCTTVVVWVDGEGLSLIFLFIFIMQSPLNKDLDLLVLCGFVCFGEFVKGIVVIPL